MLGANQAVTIYVFVSSRIFTTHFSLDSQLESSNDSNDILT